MIERHSHTCHPPYSGKTMVGMWEHVYQQQQGGGAAGEEAGPSRWQRMGQEAVRAGGWMRGVLLHGVMVDIHAVRGAGGQCVRRGLGVLIVLAATTTLSAWLLILNVSSMRRTSTATSS